MPDAIITSTASTFGTISGTFAADQSTVTGTVTGIVSGTLSGSVGVPGPAGPAGAGVPAGGTAGQFLQKIDGVNYNTDWVTVNLGNYLVKSNNLSDLTNIATARDNLQLGTLNSPTFAGVTVQGAGSNVANLGATFLTLNHTGYGQFTIQPSSGITFPDTTVQTTAFNASVLLPYAPLNSPAFTGNPTAPTAALGDNDTSLATTAFVQQELASGTAVAKNLEVYVRNQTGSTLAAGAIVYINGATGNRPTVTLAQANNDANSAQTFGFVKAAIANNGFGYVIVRGECENLDTSALTEGAQLYLSPTTAGAWTTTKPSAPQHLVYVGIVVRAHPTHGVILVAVQNGYELDELHDVSIVSKANNDLIAYDSATTLWKNKSIGTLGLATQAWVDAQGYLQAGALTGYALESWVTAGFYPLTGNPSGFLTSASLSGYATQSWVTSQGYITSAALSPYLLSSTAASTYRALSNNTFNVVDINAGNFLRVNDGGIYPEESIVENRGLIIRDGATLAPIARFMSSEVLIPSVGITFSDATTQTSAGITAATADASYYPLTGNPSSFITSSALTPYAALTGATFTGEIVTAASTTTSAGLTIPHGDTPSAPVNGEIWTTTAGLFYRINGATISPATLAGGTFTGKITTVASTTSSAGFRIPVGTAPTSPTQGDMWLVSGAAGSIVFQGNGTQTVATLGYNQTFSGNNIFSGANSTFGNSTAAGTINIGTGATISGSTRTINIGTASAAGSTNNINIGGGSGTSTITLNGTTNGVTVAADTNSTALATTAFVVGQAGSATPLVDGTAAVGTSLRYARQDHVHPTDTSRAALASPTFTGTPAAPTAAVDTNTTQIATTAYVVGQGYAKLASPALTGTPTAPTATAGTNTTQIATTAFVTAAVPALATLSDARQFTNDTKAMSPRDVIWSMLTPDFVDISGPSMTVTNTGTITYVNVGQLSRVIRPGTAGACSSRIRTFGTSQVDQTWTASSRAQPSAFLNFSLRSIHSGRSTTGGVTDANYTCAFYYGKAEADGVGNLVRRGFGWKMVGGAGSRFLELQAHNGTTLSSVTSSFAVTAGVAFDWDIESDGAGNVTLYVNGTSVATSSGGPTGAVNITGVAWQEEVVAAAALSSPYMDFTNSRGRYIVINTW